MLQKTEPDFASDCNPPASRESVPEPGTLIAERYVVEDFLGRGGMGVVVAARHIQLGHRVAIKFMHRASPTGPNAARRFLREARLAVTLTSDHVAKVLDFGTLATGEAFIVMEYLPGQDLAHVLRQHGAMAISDAVRVVLQACEAIAEAHSLGIVHRDLKPANLFITKETDGTPFVKVLDFGISKMLALNSPQQSSVSSTGLVMGSPGYMSPEQVRNAKAVDARSDVWAVGAILYELLTGLPAFGGETAGEVFARVVTAPPRPIKQLRADIPDDLAMAVAQCLEPDVSHRLQTIGDLASKLLPFAPVGAKLSVDRIHSLRVASAGSTVWTQEPVAAAKTPRTFPDVQGTHVARHKSNLSVKGGPATARRVITAVAALVAIVAVCRLSADARHVGAPERAASGALDAPPDRDTSSAVMPLVADAAAASPLASRSIPAATIIPNKPFDGGARSTMPSTDGGFKTSEFNHTWPAARPSARTSITNEEDIF